MTTIEGLGTPEEVWSAWPAPAGWPALDLSTPPPRVVVVAPHPDDEVLGVGGLLRLLADVGTRVVVVAVTDGDASHPGSPTLTPEALARTRAEERTAALRRLDVGADVHRLGLPDGDVADGEHVLLAVLHELLRPDDWCIATWHGDGHPDHEATGRAATLATETVGAVLLETPIWTWHWAGPDDARVPWSRARTVHLPDEVLAAKRAAIDAYASQIAPLSDDEADAAILPPPVLARLVRPFETVFV